MNMKYILTIATVPRGAVYCRVLTQFLIKVIDLEKPLGVLNICLCTKKIQQQTKIQIYLSLWYNVLLHILHITKL